MTPENLNREDGLNHAVRRSFDVPIPAKVQAKLEETYASLREVPQECADAAAQGSASAAAQRHSNASSACGSTNASAHAVSRPHVVSAAGRSCEGCAAAKRVSPTRRAHARQEAKKGSRIMRRGVVIAVAAALVALFGGSAFAVSRLIEMQPGDAPFFGSGSNLPIYNSLQLGVSSLNAPVGDTVEVDGVKVTLDAVSSDRNIVNLFFTLEKEGGFDLIEQSNYEGSQENEWSRLQRLAPCFSYSLASGGESVGSGQVNVLDAYQENDAVKCMMRIVPEATLPDQVDIALDGWAPWAPNSEDGRSSFSMTVGLDLNTVEQPRELGKQDIAFPTSEGEKTIGIERFTASELGTVMVVRNDNVWSGEPGTEGSSYGPPDNVLSSYALKVTDDQGNVLTPVGAGDGSGRSLDGTQVFEFAGLSSDAQSVTFTPMTSVANWESMTVDERKALNEQNRQHVDVSQIGTKLETSEYGGYELTGWDVADRTVTITLKPYGWQTAFGSMELIPEQEVPYLASEFTNPDGQLGISYHSGIMYRKYDYLTGEFVQMVSYYAASDEDLRGVTQYGYGSFFGMSREEAEAAQTLSF